MKFDLGIPVNQGFGIDIVFRNHIYEIQKAKKNKTIKNTQECIISKFK